MPLPACNGKVNEAAHDRPPHAIVQFLQALNNPFIYVLLTLVAISFFTDCWLPMRSAAIRRGRPDRAFMSGNRAAWT
jgi:magnesium-transporting ATPase (P-type)